MTAKECYSKKPTSHRKITVRDINDPSSWYIIYDDKSVTRCFYEHDNDVYLSFEEMDSMGDVFEIVPELIDQYEIAKDKIFSMIVCKDYYTGKEIKELFETVVKLSKKFYGDTRQDHQNFYDKYVVSKYPLSDNTLYCIKRKSIGEIVCYKKEKNNYDGI